MSLNGGRVLNVRAVFPLKSVTELLLCIGGQPDFLKLAETLNTPVGLSRLPVTEPGARPRRRGRVT